VTNPGNPGPSPEGHKTDVCVCVFAPGTARCIVMSVPVCLSVYVCSHISKPYSQTSPNFLCVLTVAVAVAVARFCSGACHYDMLCTSGFADDVMFSIMGLIAHRVRVSSEWIA